MSRKVVLTRDLCPRPVVCSSHRGRPSRKSQSASAKERFDIIFSIPSRSTMCAPEVKLLCSCFGTDSPRLESLKAFLRSSEEDGYSLLFSTIHLSLWT